MNKEHNSSICGVCKKYGDWSTTTDTIEWFKKHNEVGVKLVIGKINQILERSRE